MSEANLSQADLSGADLSQTNLSGANLTKAIYNQETKWNEGFDPAAAGAVKKKKWLFF